MYGNAQPSITSVGNLSTLTVTGNISVGNVLIGSGGAIGVAPQNEIHVARNGSDTNGNGSVTNPYRTITHALTFVGSGDTIVVHPGNYTEDVAIDNLLAIAITASQPGSGTPQSYSITGNVTVSGTSGSILLHSIGVIGNITHSSSGSLYVTAIQMGTSNNSTTFTKSGTGYLEVTNGNWAAGTPAVAITGNGLVTFNGVQLTNLTVNNANASVVLRSVPSAVNTTLTSGTLTVINSTMVGNSNTAPAITTVAGTLNIQNSILLRANNTAGTMTVGATTAYLYDDIFFDRANSTLSGIPISGTAFAPPAEFQAISADSMSVRGNITGNNLSLAGNITSNIGFTGANITINNAPGGNEGAEIKWALPSAGNTVLNTILVQDVFQNGMRFFEAGGNSRGLYMDLGNVPNGSGTAVGYRDIPQVSFTANATLAATDAGRHYYSTLATANTLTIANNTSVPWSVGTAISIVNRGSGNIIIAQGTGVSLYLAGNAVAGNRTVTTYGMATLLNVAANVWMINGTGVS